MKALAGNGPWPGANGSRLTTLSPRILYFVCCILSASAFATELLPAIPDTIVVRDWLFCGPFPVGVREGITGIDIDPVTFRPVPGETLCSGLVQGGKVVWHKVEADSAGWFETGYENVRWDTIQDYYGVAGLMSIGYAYAEFVCTTSCRALAITHRTGFNLNGLGYQGNSYGERWVSTPVKLDSGKNRVLVVVSSFGDEKARFMLVPPASPVMTVCADATVPDAIADSSLKAWFGIPVLNTTPERADSVELCFSIPGDSDGADTARVFSTTVSNVPGLGAKKVPVQLSLPAWASDSARKPVAVTARWRGSTFEDTIWLRIRSTGQPHKRTFISRIDSSCQYYAILYPGEDRIRETGDKIQESEGQRLEAVKVGGEERFLTPFGDVGRIGMTGHGADKRCGVILSLHGAGVEASGLAESFKPKDWAFVVCPTNRRPYGFDWQDWGRLDAIEVLELVLARFPVNPDRVYLTGHSMGGHGTWHVGLAHPDLFAAAGVGAGWPSFELYVPWFLQRTETFAEPAQQAVRDMALAPDNAPAFLPNAANLPFFILHGGDDDNVPPIHGRNFAAWLSELGYEYVHKEVPGRGHWWRYEDLDLSVVDDTDLMAFFRARSRNPGPRHVRFRTADLGQSNRCSWLTIDRMSTVGRLAEVEAWAGDSLVTVSTRNVSQLSLELDERLFFPGKVELELDGQHVKSKLALPAHVSLHRRAGRWVLGPERTPEVRKTSRLYGPAKQAMMSPFLLVYGTADTGLTEYLRHTANQEATRWWLRANGLAEVLPDSEVTDTLAVTRNLVLYGGPQENTLTRRIASGLPIRAEKSGLLLGTKNLGDSLAALFVYPNPLNPDRLVLVRLGTDAEHTRLATFWGILHSGAGVPDFMVFDRRVKRYGWAGVRAAGFFGPNWNLDPASTYLQE